jgi:hypothetical protein
MAEGRFDMESLWPHLRVLDAADQYFGLPNQYGWAYFCEFLIQCLPFTQKTISG